MKFKTSRRDFLRVGFSNVVFTLLSRLYVQAQLQPFELSLRRDQDLPRTMNINDCIMGKLYLGSGSLSDPGQFLCDTLELPFRNELNEISCIKPALYKASVVTAPTAEGKNLGWRLLLAGTVQVAIEIHTGNILDHTHGCILVGKRSENPCEIIGGTSVPARDKIKSIYGDNNKRAASLLVLN